MNLQIINIYSTTVLYLLWATAAVRLLIAKDCALKYHKMQSSSFQGQLKILYMVVLKGDHDIT